MSTSRQQPRRFGLPPLPGLGPRRRLNATRRLLLWWFGPPQPAHQNATVSIDITAGQAYLEQLNTGQDRRVTLNHLVAAAITRALVAHPIANARIVGWRVYQSPHVGIAMPVSLEGHAGEQRGELSMAIVPETEKLSLRGLARRASRVVHGERTGKGKTPLVDGFFYLAEHVPTRALRLVFEGISRTLRHPLPAALFWSQAPATTAVTNPGAAMADIPGGLARGLSLSLPARGLSLSTLWGLSAVQEEVRVVEGELLSRPCLPLMLAFDHRTVDAILAGRLYAHVARSLAQPAAAFGEAGELVLGEGAGAPG